MWEKLVARLKSLIGVCIELAINSKPGFLGLVWKVKLVGFFRTMDFFECVSVSVEIMEGLSALFTICWRFNPLLPQ